MVKLRLRSFADEIQRQVDRITRITDQFCARYLDEEYAELCRRLTGRLRNKSPGYPPIRRGVPRVWAASILQTIGRMNRLFHPASRPHLARRELWMGPSHDTMDRKEEFIRGYLGLQAFEPDLLRRCLRWQHPGVWLVSFNGRILDARTMHPEFQDWARREKMIPAEPWNYADDEDDPAPEPADATPPSGNGSP